MNTLIQNGQYLATLDQAEVKLSAKGNTVLCFRWRLERSGELIMLYAGLMMKDGTENTRGIALLKRWCPAWDGDPYWFCEHLDEARAYAVKLSIVNEPDWRDASKIVPVVKWVNPANPAIAKPATAAERPGLPPDIELEPTMQDTWRLWCAMTGRCSATFRDKTWLWYVHETDANKDQCDFTSDDWARMQQHIKLG